MQIPDFNLKELSGIADFLRETTGIFFDESNSMGLKVAVKERMIATSLKDPDVYAVRLKSSSSECEDLISLISVPETYFFRDKRQFEALRDIILPEMVAKKMKNAPGMKPFIQIASCGCS